MNNFFEKLTGGDKKNQSQKRNPFANIGKPKPNFGGGKTLGGSQPGKLISVDLPIAGPLGMKIEKRPNSQGTAIVALVIEGGQAEAAGLQRGDILCHRGSDGNEEIMYDQFVAMASSDKRPLMFDILRIQTTPAASGGNSKSAEAHARKRAVIAAAEQRERVSKGKTKPGSKKKDALPALLSTKEKLQQDRERQERAAQASAQPMSVEAQRAVQLARQGEEVHATQLGYNPYESAKTTAGQARNATVAMTHGTIQNTSSSGGASAVPAAPAPSPPSNEVKEDTPPVSSAFEDAMATLVTTNEFGTVVSSLGIMRKLIVNATSKGQGPDETAAAKFRRVRLSNNKIKKAITDMNGALDLMLCIEFQLSTEEEAGDTFLVYPPGDTGPIWLPNALMTMQQYETA